MSNLTPMMRQYADLKEQVPEALLLFRMGDFYELFFSDAEEASRLLGLTLTSRDKGSSPIPMAGFPYHALDMYLRRLLEAGRRVAICEQVEDPRHAVGLVKREVTRVVSPGTITDEALLDPRRNNFLAAIAPPLARRARGKGAAAAPDAGRFGLAWIDLSAGIVHVADCEPEHLPGELARLEPTECLAPEGWTPTEPPLALPALTPRPGLSFLHRNALAAVAGHFGVKTLGGFGVRDDSPGVRAAGALLAYLIETQRTDLKHVSRLVRQEPGDAMILDPVTRRSLEVTRTLRENRREGSLLDAIDRTTTSAGARRLGEWLSQPLTRVEAIRARHAAVAEWMDDRTARRELRELLRETYDVERLVARISTARTHPRDLAALRETLRRLPPIKARLAARNASANASLEARLDLFAELRERLEKMLVDEPPIAVKEGGIVRDGYSADLDELRAIARGGKDWMAEFQRTQAGRTGITNLKVGFNKVFGFYLEVTHSFRAKVPPEWQRKQTIKNAERYVTPELKEFEHKVLTAEERAKDLEYELFSTLREQASRRTRELQVLSDVLAELDCHLGLAELAQSRRYVRPEMTDLAELWIEGGRHPVLDQALPAGTFVPNDVDLSSERGDFLLITGPNMAGKSTYIRQAALLVLMAQAGSFVPASAARIGVVDRIFTRVGASDELGRGQSTFMVEMTETANILNNATPRSLVILDEIGRGTSTYDGVSLAWAIAEHLHDRIGCRTLFATHYHELIELEKTLPRLRNASAAVREANEEVVFLHQIVPGGADRSYGIHVAKLAGLPRAVLERARTILDLLERDPFGREARSAAGRPKKHRRTYHQLPLFPEPSPHPLLEELRSLSLEELDPRTALEWLRSWRERIDPVD